MRYKPMIIIALLAMNSTLKTNPKNQSNHRRPCCTKVVDDHQNYNTNQNAYKTIKGLTYHNRHQLLRVINVIPVLTGIGLVVNDNPADRAYKTVLMMLASAPNLITTVDPVPKSENSPWRYMGKSAFYGYSLALAYYWMTNKDTGNSFTTSVAIATATNLLYYGGHDIYNYFIKSTEPKEHTHKD